MARSMGKPVRVGLVGLSFGAEFIPIYQQHPQAEVAAICQRDPVSLHTWGDRFAIPRERRFTSYAELLAQPDIDAVHLNTPIPLHTEQTIAALSAGKHCACTIPMATTVEGCAAILRAQQRSGMVFMLMETACYMREFLFLQDLLRRGELGRLQFLRSFHQQEMAGWPSYWEGLPPMHYATHCIAPLAELAGTTVSRVACIGSGRIPDALAIRHGSPFAVESAHLELVDSDVGCEVTRSLFATAREYIEGFNVYGSRRSFEWAPTHGEGHTQPLLFVGERAEPVAVPDFSDRLPEAIRSFTHSSLYDGPEGHDRRNGHSGSHPHLVHEFVSAIADDRPVAIDPVRAANWTCAGILAHESAMRGGTWIDLPGFTQPRRA